MFFLLCKQGRRTSERFIKPAIPIPSLGLNTSAPNILSHHGILGNNSSASSTSSQHHQHHHHHQLSGNPNSSNNSSTVGSNPNSLNSSSSSNTTFPPNLNNSITFAGHSSSFTQPASPMDTSVCKD